MNRRRVFAAAAGIAMLFAAAGSGPTVSYADTQTIVITGPIAPPPPMPLPPDAPGPILEPRCGPSDLDEGLAFRAADKRQEIDIAFRNISGRSCTLPPVEAIGFGSGADRNAGVEAACPDCDRPGTHRAASLAPAATAVVTLSVPTESAAASGACRDAEYLSVMLGDRRSDPKLRFGLDFSAIMMRACAPARFSPYLTVDDRSVPGREAPTLTLTVEHSVYYTDEIVRLHVAATGARPVVAKALKACPRLAVMTKVRYAQGETALTLTELGLDRPEWRNGFAAIPVTRAHMGTHWEAAGTAKFPDELVYESTEPKDARHEAAYVSLSDDGWRTVARSNSVGVQAVDPPVTEPDWGPQADGFAVALAVERDRYQLGQDIPLHIACTRFGQGWTMTHNGLGSLCDATVTVADADGRPVKPTEERFRGGSYVPQLAHVEKETVIRPPPLSLRRAAFLPQVPGTYQLTAIWTARDDDVPDPEPVTVQSPPVTVHIVGPAP